LREDQTEEAASLQPEGTIEHVLVRKVDEEIGYSHAVQVNWRSLAYRRSVDMIHSVERASECVLEAILWASESEAG